MWVFLGVIGLNLRKVLLFVKVHHSLLTAQYTPLMASPATRARVSWVADRVTAFP